MKQRIKDAITISTLSILSIVSFGCVSAAHRMEPKTQDAPVETPKKSPIKPANERDVYWLAMNIYHEARGESVDGMYAVGIVTMNRLKDEKYPKTIEKVVKQRSQFSWFGRGRSIIASDRESWALCKQIAKDILEGRDSRTYLKVKRKVGHAVFYHANYAKPSWSRHKQFITRIDKHLFYI